MEQEPIIVSGFIEFSKIYVNDLNLKLIAQIDSYAFAKESLMWRYRDQFKDQFTAVERIINVLEAETDIKSIFPEP